MKEPTITVTFIETVDLVSVEFWEYKQHKYSTEPSALTCYRVSVYIISL